MVESHDMIDGKGIQIAIETKFQLGDYTNYVAYVSVEYGR